MMSWSSHASTSCCLLATAVVHACLGITTSCFTIAASLCRWHLQPLGACHSSCIIAIWPSVLRVTPHPVFVGKFTARAVETLGVPLLVGCMRIPDASKALMQHAPVCALHHSAQGGQFTSCLKPAAQRTGRHMLHVCPLLASVVGMLLSHVILHCPQPTSCLTLLHVILFLPLYFCRSWSDLQMRFCRMPAPIMMT